jgi:DNA-binding FrmR family transcriptional regulator
MQAEKHEVLKRLAYIEGHVRGIRKMVEDDQYCVDILKQTHAVKRALDKLDALLLQGHLRTCVPTGIREGRDEQVTRELTELFELARR